MYCLESDPMKTFIFVGDRKVGKTNLILKFLDIRVESIESVKETISLDFKYGFTKHNEEKIRLNSYEIGGGRVVANIL